MWLFLKKTISNLYQPLNPLTSAVDRTLAICWLLLCKSSRFCPWKKLSRRDRRPFILPRRHEIIHITLINQAASTRAAGTAGSRNQIDSPDGSPFCWHFRCHRRHFEALQDHSLNSSRVFSYSETWLINQSILYHCLSLSLPLSLCVSGSVSVALSYQQIPSSMKHLGTSGQVGVRGVGYPADFRKQY